METKQRIVEETKWVGIKKFTGGINRPLGGSMDIGLEDAYTCQNLVLGQGVAHTRPGRVVLGDQVAEDKSVLHIDNVRLDEDEEPQVYAITTARLYHKNGDAYDVIGGAGWNIQKDSHVSTTVLKEDAETTYFIALGPRKRGIRYIKSRAGGTHVYDGNFPVDKWHKEIGALLVTNLNGHLVFLNMWEGGQLFPDRVRWSAYGYPMELNEQVGTAGLSDLDAPTSTTMGKGVIVAAEKLYLQNGQEVLVIYQEWGVHLMSWVGGAQIFAFRTILFDEGAASPRSVVPVQTPKGDFHIVFGRKGPYMFNGSSSIVDLGQHRIIDWLSDLGLFGVNSYKIFGYNKPAENRVAFHIPMTIDPSLTWDTAPVGDTWDDWTTVTWDQTFQPNAVIEFNYEENSWTIHTLPDNICSAVVWSTRPHPLKLGTVFNEMLYGTSDGYVLVDELDAGYDRNTNIASRLDTKTFTFHDENFYYSRKGRVQKVGIEVAGEGQLTVYGSFDGGGWALLGTFTMASTYGLFYVYPNTTCKYMQLSFRATEYGEADDPSYMYLKRGLIAFIPTSGR